MTKANLHLDFQGYWRDENRMGIPSLPGVFCVYRCRPERDETGLDRVRVLELLYIDETSSAHRRLRNAPELQKWRNALEPGEELCFSFAPVVMERHDAAAVLTRRHRPRLNDLAETPGHPALELNLSGQIAGLQPSFRMPACPIPREAAAQEFPELVAALA